MYSSPSKAGLKQEDSGLKCAVIVIGRLHLLSLPETLVRKHSPKVYHEEYREGGAIITG
jgi:hypothetical protein